MKISIKFSSLTLLLLSIFLFSCVTTQKFITKRGQITVSTNLDDASQDDIERVAKEAKVAIDNICPLLGINCNKRIEIEIVRGGICHVNEGIMYLPLWRVQKKKAPVVHEVTHIIAKHSDNRFFSEGIAVYFQERFGEDALPMMSGMPLHDKTNSYIESQEVIPLSDLKSNNDIFSTVGNHKRKIAYAEAGSFFAFLVEKYGGQKLRALHNSWSLNYKEVYGKNMKELEREWLVFVSSKK